MFHLGFRALGIVISLLLLGGCASDSTGVIHEEQPDYIQGYADKIRECEEAAADLHYDLIYLDEDEIPELVVGQTGYNVSVYTFSSGKLYTIIEDWPYGAMGNAGYEYIPKKNVIRNENADLAGAILYISYDRVNGEHEIESYYEKTLSSWAFRDINHNYAIDDNEPITEDRYYYYGDQEITAEEYETYFIIGEYHWLQGSKDASEILVELEGMML